VVSIFNLTILVKVKLEYHNNFNVIVRLIKG
jgi:hypothetical protein